jgi:hypothetical protein
MLGRRPAGDAARDSAAQRPEAEMAQGDGARPRADSAGDHAGGILLSILAQVPDVSVRQVGCSEVEDGVMSYSISVNLPGGRELLVDVEDV